MKRRSRSRKLTLLITAVLLVASAAFIYGAYELLHQHELYEQGDAVYKKMAETVRRSSAGTQRDYTTRNIPDINIDISALADDNVAGWLYSPGTVIDYPVMEATDYSYYLHRLPDGTENVNGSLFIDYNCAQDFSDRLSVIYGHHMKSGKMFGSLVGYKKQDYYDEHPYMYLYARDKNYRVELLCGCVIGAGEWRKNGYMYQQNADSLLDYAKKNTTFHSAVAQNEGDSYVAMSTCTYEFDDARYVAIGLLKPLS